MNEAPDASASMQPDSTIVPAPYAADATAAPYALYSPEAVALAAFLGGPVGGTALMAINYRRMGRASSALKAMIWGVIGTAALIAVGFALPDNSPGYAIALIPVAIIAALARMYQGEVFSQHKLAGGKIASKWKAAGLGLVSLIVLLGIIVAVAIAVTRSTGIRMPFGKSEILYSGHATPADAQALGKALTDIGYFGDHATSVLLAKDSSGTTIKFVISEEAAKNQSTVDAFTKITETVASSVGGKPITLKLVSPELKELKSKKVE